MRIGACLLAALTLSLPGPVSAETVVAPLECFRLEDLVLLELHGDGPDGDAVLRAPNGIVDRVRRDDYIGDDFGRVVAVGRDGLRLIELCQDSQGDWHEATALITRGGGRESSRVTRLRPEGCLAGAPRHAKSISTRPSVYFTTCGHERGTHHEQ